MSDARRDNGSDFVFGTSERTSNQCQSFPFDHVIFDFDGVILDSAGMKTRAFATIYESEHEDLVSTVIEYQEMHGGVGRREKFRYFETEVFRRAPSETRLDELCAQFARIVDEGMRQASFIPGILDLLDRLSGATTMHVVSGMPDTDLKRICAERALTGFFSQLIGTPQTKLEAFANIVSTARSNVSKFVAIGDSLTEFEAASAMGMGFLAVVPILDQPFDRFPASVRKVRDFADTDEVIARMSAATLHPVPIC